MKKITSKIWLLAVLLIVLLVLSSETLVSTYPNQYTLIRQFGKIERIIETPGLSLKTPFIQSAIPIPKNMQLYDIAPSDVITRDKKTMVADCFVLWKVSDPLKYVRSLNGNENAAEARINTIVFNALKNVISSLNQSEVISGRDGELTAAIMSAIDDNMSEYGIKITSVETKSLDLPDDNKESVYERMVSERNNIAASFRAEGDSEATKIRTETDTQIQVKISDAKAVAEKTRAEGEAEYMNILSAAYNDANKAEFYSFVRALDATRLSMGGKEKTIILDKDSPLAQIFYGR